MVSHGQNKLVVFACILRLSLYPLKALIRKAAFSREIAVVIKCKKPVTVGKLHYIRHTVSMNSNRFIGAELFIHIIELLTLCGRDFHLFIAYKAVCQAVILIVVGCRKNINAFSALF